MNTVRNIIPNKQEMIKKGAEAVIIGTVVAKVSVAGLTASGVGIPLAAVIATALVIANVFAEMKISNIELTKVIGHTLTIISNCYMLNDYIEFVECHIKTFKVNSSGESQLTTTHNEPNDEIDKLKETLKHMLSELINRLLSIVTNEMLGKLINETKPNGNTLIQTLAIDEAKKRGYNFTNFFSAVNKLTERLTARTFDANKTISFIIRDLTIINGFFILIKSHFDVYLHAFEMSLSGENVKRFWENVKKSGDFKPTVNEPCKFDENNGLSNNPYTRYLNGNAKAVVDAAKQETDNMSAQEQKLLETQVTELEKNTNATTTDPTPSTNA